MEKNLDSTCRHEGVRARSAGIMRKFVAGAMLAGGLTVASATPATAAPSQAGCQAYGAFVSGVAQSGILGKIASATATSGPGAVANLSLTLRQATCG